MVLAVHSSDGTEEQYGSYKSGKFETPRHSGMSYICGTHRNYKLLEYLNRAIKKKRQKLKTSLQKPKFFPRKQIQYQNICVPFMYFKKLEGQTRIQISF
jgi:hypothetical protein